MESPGGGCPGAAAQSREPLSGCRRPWRHSGFFSNPTAGRLRPWGREGLFSLQQDSRHKLGEENRIKGRGRDLAFWQHPHPHPFPTQNLGRLEREVCTTSPGGGARAAVVLHPQPPAPTPVLGTGSSSKPPAPVLGFLFELLPHAGMWSTPEVAAPAPERADLEDPNSGRRWGPWASRLSGGDDSMVSGDPGSRKKLVLLLCCQ